MESHCDQYCGRQTVRRKGFCIFTDLVIDWDNIVSSLSTSNISARTQVASMRLTLETDPTSSGLRTMDSGSISMAPIHSGSSRGFLVTYTRGLLTSTEIDCS